MLLPGLTPYLTPAMLLSTNYGVSWNTWPTPRSTERERYAAQLGICQIVTSTMDTIANQTLRASLGTEIEFGPDFTVTTRSNGWVRMRLSRWPIVQIVSAQVSTATADPDWQDIPVAQIQMEHSGLPLYGTTVPSSAGPGPVAVLIPPGFVSWANGRNGYLVSVTYINGSPVTGVDTAAVAGATSIHVNDITGWWNGTAGARGTIHDGAATETVTVSGATPDSGTLPVGPGVMDLASPLVFTHSLPTEGEDTTILLSAMPGALMQAGYYLAVHYGLIRGTTAATVQSARGAVTASTSTGNWYQQAEQVIARYARVF